jgi:hypothetical protein
LTSSFKDFASRKKKKNVAFFYLLSLMKDWDKSLKALYLKELKQYSWQSLKSHCFSLPKWEGEEREREKKKKLRKQGGNKK